MIEDIEIVATLPPLHPGEILREEFVVPLGLSASGIAQICNLSRMLIERILAEDSDINGDTALRLGLLLGTTPEFWLNAQANYDLEIARATLAGEGIDIKPVVSHAA